MRKPIWIVLLLMIVCLFTFSACDESNDPKTQNKDHIHAYGEWITTKKASCASDGINERYCSCGDQQTQTIGALGHDEVIDAAINATCTADGKTEGKHCSRCEETLVAQTVIGKLGHVEVIDAAVDATCTTDGKTEGKHCAVCHATLVSQTIVKALGHTAVTVNAVAPTCTEAGLTEGKHCAICADVLVAQTVINALGHTYSDEWAMNDKYHWHQSTCGHTQEILEKTEHIYGDDRYCDICGFDIMEIFVCEYYEPDKAWHIFGFKNSQISYTQLFIPSCVSCIRSNSFKNCQSLESIIISDSVAVIENQAFLNCDSLVTVIIGKLPNTLGENAFYDCNNLKTVVIEGSKTLKIDNSVFSHCHSLTNVTIEDCKTMGDSVFYNCYNLTSFIIPDNVTSIGAFIFEGCSKLSSITIGKKLWSVGENAFEGCVELSFVYANDIGAWCGIQWGNMMANPLFYAGKMYHKNEIGTYELTENIVLSNTVTEISDYAFVNCDSLISIVMPDSVEKIGGWAFDDCTNLVSLEMSSNVCEYGNYAFSNCTALTSIVIPKTVKKIGRCAFFGCFRLKSVIFENPSGWLIHREGEENIVGQMSKDKLSVAATAAEYLRVNYYHCYWVHE